MSAPVPAGNRDARAPALPFRRSGDVLLVLPPFAAMNRPSLGLEILRQIAVDEGLACDIYYATLDLARVLGEDAYVTVSERHNLDLVAERLFSSYAFPDDEFGWDESGREQAPDWFRHRISATGRGGFADLEARIGDWLAEFRVMARGLDYRVFGLSTMFSQTLCCASMARILKEQRPESTVLIGGANCDGEMSRGIAALSPHFDHVFVGEAEKTFRTFCRGLRQGRLPSERVIVGEPTFDLDANPCPDYGGYFRQLSHFLPASLVAEKGVVIPYETSRGCWWGQKHHCTFCGLNPEGMTSRAKSPAKALADLRELRRRHGKRLVDMTDNIMPLQYFKTLLPAIADEGLDLDIFYEQKSNLDFERLRLLKGAGVNSIQPGIEAFSTALLRRMRKGVTGAQNLRLLRDCRSIGISTSWNLLFNFPGDSDADYEETLSLIRHLRHLSPPMGFLPVFYDRFSPYFREPEAFGITGLRPFEGYAAAYPARFSPADFAYHFVGDADVVEKRNPALVARVEDEVREWIRMWRARKPVLSVARFPNGQYAVYDTRGEGNPAVDVVDRATAALVTGEAREETASAREALARGWMAAVDGIYVGLAVAAPRLVAGLRASAPVEERIPA